MHSCYRYLHAFEDFYRKLGSSMGTISRPSRGQNDSGRSLLSFRGREAGRISDKVRHCRFSYCSLNVFV